MEPGQRSEAAITDGKVLVSGLDRSADYYILPDSDRKEISYETMYGLTEPQKQMAINEIYARRGRKFVITEIQDYFNEKSWYKGQWKLRISMKKCLMIMKTAISPSCWKPWMRRMPRKQFIRILQGLFLCGQRTDSGAECKSIYRCVL